MLLGTVAAGALLLGYGRRAYAACAGPAPTLTCTGVIAGTAPPGVVNGGISLGAPYTTLDVNSLMANITPASGTDGIRFNSNGAITITSDTGAFNIQATGANAEGIYTHTSGATSGVTIDSTGDLSSMSSYGIFAQADGSGAVSVTSSGNVESRLTGINAYSAYGGVTVDSTGDVTSSNGRGIVARTYGAAAVSVTSDGAIMAASDGIYAYSPFGTVTLDSTGDITSTTGDAIRAVASGGSTITLRSGTVYGADVGVDMSVLAPNTLTNYASLSGGNRAILGNLGGGNDTVHNYGIISGDVVLGPGTNAFNNRAGGTFNPGATVNLGAGNTLTNAGNLSPGGTGTAATTALTGNLVQTGTGTFTVDINEGGASDLVTVTGTAAFAGTVTPNILNLSSATGSVAIATAQTLTSTATAVDTGGINFALSVQGNQLLLTWGGQMPQTILSLLANANANQRAIAAYLDAANTAGPSAGLQALIDALVALNETELLAALNQLIPGLYSDAQIAALYASLGFANSLLSCKVNGTDTASIIREGQCLWAGASANFLDQGSTFNQIGFTETAGLFAAGAQVALTPAWRFGFGASYQQSSLDTATAATSDGETAQGGVALKYNPGPLLLAGVVNAGRGWYESRRPVAFTGFSGTAQSDSVTDILNGAVRAAYVLGSPQLYFKPMVDAAATRLDLGGFSESGGGAANLTVLGTRQTVYTIAPSLEIGTEWWLANGTLMRPYVRGGAAWYENGDLALSAAFLGAPASITPFTIHTNMDDVLGTVGAGLDLITDKNTVLHLTYDGQLGDTTQIQAVALKGSARF